MVRRDATDVSPLSGGGAPAARCASPAGESPAPVGVGAPGSRPQVAGGDPHARAGCQKPVTRREPSSGKRAHGPQHKVKPATSTESQSGGRAAHVTAKATPAALVPKRAVGSGGVRGAARVQGGVRNTRDPSARPSSGQGVSYKPKAKSAAAQRESEGPIVPLMVVTNNATGGKEPCFGHARSEGKCEGMAGKTGPNHPGARMCDVQVREPQRGLWAGAKRSGPPARCVPRPPWSDACGWTYRFGRMRTVQASSRRPSVSRVREIRTHGLKGGPAPWPVFTRQQ